VAQNPGVVLDNILRVSKEFGFRVKADPKGEQSSVIGVRTVGGWRENLRTMGVLRPIRLLSTFESFLETGRFRKQMDGIGAPLEIVKSYSEGTQECSGIETSSRTYLCEGFGAHNSVGQHCVLGSYVVEEQTKNLIFALAFLLHDSGESYLGDMTRPLKNMPELEAYRLADNRLNRVIEKRFLLPEGIFDEKIIKEVDTRMLFTEKRDLLVSLQWGHSVPPYNFKIKPWGWRKTQRKYLERYHELCLRLDGYPKVVTQAFQLTRLLPAIGKALSTREQ
jgi:5'-deoxynucleotidase YfbR-like HD superfamily hydrolase